MTDMSVCLLLSDGKSARVSHTHITDETLYWNFVFVELRGIFLRNQGEGIVASDYFLWLLVMVCLWTFTGVIIVMGF